jgi:mRNA interferase RelE/StbE
MRMTRRIIYAPSAVKAMSRMDVSTRKRIESKVKQLAAHPGSLANNIKPLRGMAGVSRLRVGDWRVLYTEDGVILNILKVASRGSAY